MLQSHDLFPGRATWDNAIHFSQFSTLLKAANKPLTPVQSSVTAQRPRLCIAGSNCQSNYSMIWPIYFPSQN